MVIFPYDFTLKGTIPSWTFFYSAFAIFAYQTLDSLDGIHARNINASSPLGQLFDHGIDAFAHGVLTMIHLQALSTGSSSFSFVILSTLAVTISYVIT